LLLNLFNVSFSFIDVPIVNVIGNYTVEIVIVQLERERAKQRQEDAGRLFGKGKDSLGSNEHQLSEGKDDLANSLDDCVEVTGLNYRTVALYLRPDYKLLAYLFSV